MPQKIHPLGAGLIRKYCAWLDIIAAIDNNNTKGFRQ